MIEIQGKMYCNDVRGIAPYRGKDAGNGTLELESAPVTDMDKMIMEAFCGACPLWQERGRISQPHGALQAALVRCTGFKADGEVMKAVFSLSATAQGASKDLVGKQIEDMAICKYNPSRHNLP